MLQELIDKMCRIAIFIYNFIKHINILRVFENHKSIFTSFMKGMCY